MRPSCFAVALGAVTALALVIPSVSLAEAQPLGDVFDQFFRYTEKEHKAFFSELPGETVDPFTGTLRIVQEDLTLPGKAGLDLHIVRAYASKIWGRADLLDMEPLLAEKEHSVLGYGWTFHMGRLKNPNASGSSDICGGDFPIYEAPDGTARVFYPMTGSNTVFRSKDYWKMEKNCSALGGAGACVWSDSGVRFEFSSSSDNQYFYGGTTQVWPVSGIVDLFGNRISVSYVSQTGAPDSIVDTYRRTVTFRYSTGIDGRRLDAMDANGNTYQYFYRAYDTWAGPRRFLTEVKPPVGPSDLYEYAHNDTVDHNQYALKTVTYPSGGSATYIYESVPFFTGRETVPFSVVTRRTVADRGGVTIGSWTYSYSSPSYDCKHANTCATDPGTGKPTNMHVTTIGRPDGKHDSYIIAGFGFVADVANLAKGYTYGVGLPLEIARADRAEVEERSWRPNEAAPISSAFYSAPAYSGNCGAYYVWDGAVWAAVMTKRVLFRDQAVYTTEYSDFDEYNQPHTVVETGVQAAYSENGQAPQVRTSAWTYLAVPELNIVRSRPLSQHVCVGSECFDNSWTYDPNHGYARDSETQSGVRTTFGYDPSGNLARVTNSLNQTLTLDTYVNGIPTSIGFNRAFTITRIPSWEGWILSEMNGRNYTTGYEYDAIGRIKTVTPPGNNNYTGYTYASDGSSVTLARGDYFLNTNLDGLGRAIATSDSEGVQTSVRYDNMGRAWFRSYPWEPITGEVGDGMEFDGLGRVVTRTKAYRPATGVCDAPGACTVTIAYFGNCIGRTVNRGINDAPKTWQCNTSYGNADEQRLTQVLDANGSLWQYVYSAHGNLKGASVLGASGPLPRGNRAYAYDSRQFLTGETAGESGTTTFERNGVGQMTRRTDARSVSATYHYNDPLSRLTDITYGSADDVSKRYDDANNVTHVESQNGGAFDYVYDELNRVTSQTWTYGNNSYTTTYHYDSAGCLDSSTYSTGARLTMTCDTANRVTSVSLGANSIVSSISYHPSGQVKAMTYGNGKSTTISYDDRGRAQTVTSPGIIGLSYWYDGADNVVSFDNSTVLESSRTMLYDHLDRLVTSIAPYQWGRADYLYDELGNRTWSGGITYTYDSKNRLASASAGPEVFAGLTLTWDLPGRLASSSDGVTYRYDGHGRRIQKDDPGQGQPTLYHYDAAGRLVSETAADGTKLRDYVYLGNKLVAVDGCVTGTPSSCSPGRQWYHTDTLGSVLARTDETGTMVAQVDYQPWGEQWRPVGVLGDRQYNGRVYDPGTGLHDYGARMYWPQVGRFISADSYRGNPADPASLNRYSYVLNNPYKYTDPTGHLAFLAALPAICAAGACEAIASAALWTAAVIGLVAVADVAVHTTGRPADAPSGSASPPGQAPVDVATSPPPPQAPVDPSLLTIPASTTAATATATTMMAEHTKGKRPSTTQKHEEGQARKQRDRGGEKGDARRDPPRKRPEDWKGPWPPPKQGP